MATLSFQIARITPDYDLPLEHEKGRHQQGDVIWVYERAQVKSPVPVNNAFAYIHVSGIPAPDAKSIRHLGEAGYLGTILLYRSKCRFLLENGTADEIAALTTALEITTTWDRAKEVLWNYGTQALIMDGDL